MPEFSDEEVVARVQEGDIESFGVLIERYEGKLMRYAKKFLLREDDGKDLVQESFIKAYTNIKNFDTKRRFSPWIYRIAHNEFVNAIKKRSRLRMIPFDLDALLPHLVAEETAESEAEKRERREALNRSLGELYPRYREPLVLYYFEDMDYESIAEVLHVPVATVGVRLRRGRMLLKKYLTPAS